MYEQFFGLVDAPFRLTPDPRYLFLSRKHAEALAHLKLGLKETSGFVCITGDVGTGKTTLLRAFLQTLGPEVSTAYIFNPALSALELLQTIASELGIGYEGDSRKAIVDALNAHLLAQRRAGRVSVVVIDEAQALSVDVLEQLRLLSNLETATEKLLRMILVGQPQLRTLLTDGDLLQLNQRITLRWHMGPLSPRETAAYIRHRLHVASRGRRTRFFTRPAIRLVYRFSRGVPRLINMVAHRSMLAAFAADRRTVTSRDVVRAYREIGALPLRATGGRRRAAWAAAAVAACLAVVAVGADRLGWGPADGSGTSADASPPAAVVSAEPPSIGNPPAASGEPPPPPASDQPVAAAPVTPPPDADQVAAPPEPPPADQAAATAQATPRPAAEPAAATAPATPPAADPAPAPEATPPPAADPPPVASGPADPPPPDVVATATPTPETAPPSPSAAAAEPATAPPAGPPPAPESPAPPADAASSDPSHALGELDRETSARTAVDDLLAAWRARPLAPDEPLDADDLTAVAQRRQLDDLRLAANASMLRLLDLPAVLELSVPGVPGPRYATVTDLRADRCTLSVGGKPMTVDGSFLRQYWVGRAHVFWRDFEALGRTFGTDASGPQVARLQRLLRRIGAYDGEETGFFDLQTTSAVLDFQRSRSLEVDGRVGRLTRIVLYGAVGGYPRPTLVRRHGAIS